MLLVADALTLYKSGEKNLYLFQILTKTVQKIKFLVKKRQPDFTEKECDDLILIALKYNQA